VKEKGALVQNESKLLDQNFDYLYLALETLGKPVTISRVFAQTARQSR
jgi:hypothetical protein